MDTRIGIDARKMAGVRTGIGHYIYELARHLPAAAPEMEFVLLSDRQLEDVPAGCRAAVVGRRAALSGSLAKLYSPWWANRVLPTSLEAESIDLLHGANYVVPFSAPCPTVMTVHDLAFVMVPEAYRFAYRRYMSFLMPRLLHKVDRVVAVSASARDDLLRIYGVEPDRISVIRHGVAESYRPVDGGANTLRVRARFALPVRFILHVGTVERRKNLEVLVSAAAPLLREGLVQAVVLAGGPGNGAVDVRRSAAREGMSDSVRFVGRVGQEDVPVLYGLASVVAIPSRYEGFGLPVLEAMACGCPVVSSNVSSLPEVAGDAALLVAPDDVEGWTAALRRVLCDDELRNRLRQQGLERASRFTWRAAAAAHVEVYRKVLESRGRA